jgi:multidrug efflux pump subunit AcrA (membrane-fusion protein)
MKLYRYNELKNSRIFFDKVPANYMMWFLYFCVFLFIASILTSFVLVKPYIVRAQGTIVAVGNQYVTSNVNGSIVEMFVTEGQEVNEGQDLLRVSNGQESLQAQALQAQLTQAEEKIEVMDKYEQSLVAKVNYLKNDGIEQEYYAYIEYYLSSMNETTRTIGLKKVELAKAIEQRVILENEIDALKKQEQMIEGDTQIDLKQNELTTTESNIKSLENEIASSSAQSDTTRLQLLTELGKARTAVMTQITELKSNVQSYTDSANTYTIKSSNKGTIHFFVPVNVGIAVQQNQVLAEVSEPTAKLIAEVYILATDITNVHINDTVNVAITGVNTVTHGTIPGEVERIDSGTIAQEQEERSILYYKAYVRLKTNMLSDKQGNNINVIKSLPIEARIIYNEETYWDWFLQQIGFNQ